MQRQTPPSARSLCTAVIAQFAALLLLCGSLPASEVRVELNAKATSSGPLVRLSDVATVTAEADRKDYLSKLALSPAPASGRNLVITITDLRDRLTALGVGLGDIEFTGANSVTVAGPAHDNEPEKPAAVPVATEHARRRMQQILAKSIHKYLQSQWKQAADHTVAVQLTDEQVAAFSQAITARYDVAGGRSPWVGKQTFAVSYQKSGGQFVAIPVAAIVELRPRCLVPKATLAAGELIASTDLEWKRLNTAPDDSRPIAMKALQIVGTEAKRTLRAGEPILLSDIRQQPLVRRGDIVTVTCRRGFVSVSTHAKATADGVLGESIPVTLIDGQRKLVAVVTGFHECEIPGTTSSRSATNAHSPPSSEPDSSISESRELETPAASEPELNNSPKRQPENLSDVAVAANPGGGR